MKSPGQSNGRGFFLFNKIPGLPSAITRIALPSAVAAVVATVVVAAAIVA
jgi:hypothetical protein